MEDFCHFLRLPHTGPLMSLRGGRCFTHFEVVRVVGLAATVMERAQTCTKNDFCISIHNFTSFLFLEAHVEVKISSLTLRIEDFSLRVKFFQAEQYNEILTHHFIRGTSLQHSNRQPAHQPNQKY